MAEKTLLQQIREKELMLNIKIEDTRREAEETVLTARKKAQESIESFEKAGKSAAEQYYKAEIEKINQEIARLRDEGKVQSGAIHDAGERRLKLAAGLIIKAVYPG